MKHWEYHPEYVDGCFGCKGMSVQMNAGDADVVYFYDNLVEPLADLVYVYRCIFSHIKLNYFFFICVYCAT